MAGRGRGRESTLPAWMTKGDWFAALPHAEAFRAHAACGGLLAFVPTIVLFLQVSRLQRQGLRLVEEPPALHQQQ